MKNSAVKRIIVRLIMTPVALIAAVSVITGRVNSSGGEPATRVFELTYKATVRDAPAGAKRLNLWLPYPVSDANQEIADVQISSSAKATVYAEPKYGNAVLFITLENPGGSQIDVELKIKVRRTEYLRKDFARFNRSASSPLDPAVAEFLKPDKLVPIEGKIKDWALQVTKGKKTDLEKARAIYDYTLATMKYDKSGQGWGRGDIYYACDAKRGNCTDFHAVFIGFCRALGIPARFAIGFPLPDKRGEGEIAGYHCWAEFYLRGYGWIPVDASEASKHPEKADYFFGAHDENRVQVSWGRDITLRPRQHSGPLNYFVYPLAEADGKSFDGVKREIRFKDLSSEDFAKAF